MKNRSTITLAMLAGFALGAAGVHGLRAQAKPPIYQITEIDVSNLEAYTREYALKAQAITGRMADATWPREKTSPGWKDMRRNGALP